jgi:arsenite methyltransferase
MQTTTRDQAELREQVRERYANLARTASASAGSCCGPAESPVVIDSDFGGDLYDREAQAELPAAALAASLGCGNPIAVAELLPGETVLDLGSGGGIDVILSARRVGADGKVYGLDMTEEMLQLARRNAAAAEVDNVEFLQGHIEDVPLADESVDVVISNCVVNLSVDKPAVFAQMRRVLRRGGRIGITDVVAEDHLSAEDRAAMGNFAGCIAGALTVTEYREGLEAAGFVDVTIRFTHDVADGLHGAIVRARRPG